MAYTSVTYTFANSTTADATQVNQNFTDVLNGLSDGTKDLNVYAFTCASSATLNGAVTLGTSTSNILTVNAALNTSLPVSANTTYDLGASTKGFRSLYLGASSTDTVRLLGGSGSTYTITFPGAVPTFAKSGFYSDTSGTLTFDQRTVRTVKASQTANFNAAGGDEVIPCNASGGSFTITLPSPAATGMTGKKLVFVRTDQTLANAVTISRNSSETINGANSITLNTQYEAYELITDGTNWYITQHTYPMGWTSYTPTFGGWSGTTNPLFYWRRVGDSIEVRGTTTAQTYSSGSNSISLPSGLTISSSKVGTDSYQGVGTVILSTGSDQTIYAATNATVAFIDLGTSTSVVYVATNVNGGFTKTAGNLNGSGLSVNFSVPITGWIA